MAVVSYREILPRTFSHKFGESPTAEIKYALTLDGPTNTQAILNAVGIFHGSAHPEYSYLLCHNGQVNETDRFHAEVTYSYEVPRHEYQQNPLARPDVWSFSTGGAQAPFLYYYHGTGNSDVRPLVNAANDYIEGMTVMAPEIQATISGNRSAFPLATAAEVTNAINSAPYLGGPAYSWMCNGISAQQAVEVVNGAQVRYWQISVQLTYRRGGYIEKIPHVGFHYIDGSQKRRAWVYQSEPGNSEKVDATTPQPLTESGALKYPGGDGRPDQLERRPYPAVSFSQYFGAPPF
jgi:hypothetical protein